MTLGAMDLWSMTPRDVRPLLTAERRELAGLLSGLTDEQWRHPTAVPGWTVKDVSLHLLGDDLGWLSRGRDRDASGLLEIDDQDTFVRALAAKNQRWADGAQGLSLPVVVGLLEWAGEQLDRYYATIDLTARGEVAWAGGPVARCPSGSTSSRTSASAPAGRCAAPDARGSSTTVGRTDPRRACGPTLTRPGAC